MSKFSIRMEATAKNCTRSKLSKTNVGVFEPLYETQSNNGNKAEGENLFILILKISKINSKNSKQNKFNILFEPKFCISCRLCANKSAARIHAIPLSVHLLNDKESKYSGLVQKSILFSLSEKYC